jgi:hypothetical protein
MMIKTIQRFCAFSYLFNSNSPTWNPGRAEFFNEFEIIEIDHFEGQSEINLSSRMDSWELYARPPSF